MSLALAKLIGYRRQECPSGDTGMCMSVVTEVKYHPTLTAAGAKCVSKRDYRK